MLGIIIATLKVNPVIKVFIMVENISVDDMLMKARSNVNKGNFFEAHKLYDAVLEAKKELMQHKLNKINELSQKNAPKNPSQETLEQLNNLYNKGRFDAVIEKAQALTQEYPQSFITWNTLGAFATEIGILDLAITAYEKAILLKPDYDEAYCNMGITYQKLSKFNEAINAYNKAISFNKNYVNAHRNLSFALLNSGRIKEGLDKYEWRWKTPIFISNQRHILQPVWDGKESLNGKKILLWHEQGIADTIIWSSCLPLIISQSKDCILECQPKLVPLLKRSFPYIKVKAEDRSLDFRRNDIDLHLPMGSLYKNFINEIMKRDKVDSYLIPNPTRVKFWKDRLNSIEKGPYIGISWKSANLTNKRLPNYAEILDLSPVLKIPNATFINLQYADFAEDLEKVADFLGVKIHNFADLDHFNNIDDVTALCAALDMVVSTQSVVASISAGVGTITKIANWKASSNNNILYKPVGPFVDKFERDTLEPWDKVFNLIANDIINYYRNTIN
tara:strand:- start:77 stop:1588 length:1512 start_codon:yes stop_codon:yes gene_type:complete